MDMVIPNEGKLMWLYWALCTAGADLEDYVLSLFKNNETVVDASVASDFDIATFVGYADVVITRASMDTPIIVANVAESECVAVPTFTCTGGSLETIYGWILVGQTSNLLLAGQNFDVPRGMAPGATEQINPFKIKLKTLD